MANTQEPVGEPRFVFDSNEPVRPPAGFDWGFAEGVKVTEKKYKEFVEAARHLYGHLGDGTCATFAKALRQLGEPHE